MKIPSIFWLALLLGACSTAPTGDQYVQSLVSACNQRGYYGDAETKCVIALHNQVSARQAAETDAMIRNMGQPRTIETNCRPDGLGGVRCTSRQ